MAQIFNCRTAILQIVHSAGQLATVFQWKGNHPSVTEEEIVKSHQIINNLKQQIQDLEILIPEPISQKKDFQLPETNTKFSQLEFEDLRVQINQWCHQRDWEQYHTPRNIVMAMIGEVSELSEIFINGEFLPGLPEMSEQQKHHTGEELADILHNLIRLSDRCEIDLVQAIKMKIIKNSVKYPIEKVKGSSLKYDEYKQ